MLKGKREAMQDLTTMAYVKVKTWISATARGLKEDVSGMEIIQVVMIIAMGILAVVAVYAALGDLLKNLWAQISGKGNLPDMDSLTPPS